MQTDGKGIQHRTVLSGETGGLRLSEVSGTPSEEDDFKDFVKHFKFSWMKLLKFAGPGLLMSIAYLDPGNSKS